MTISVNINHFNINQLTTNNVISNGENNQFGWSSHQKVINGFSTIGHHLQIRHNVTLITNQNIIDAFIDDKDSMVGYTNQSY